MPDNDSIDTVISRHLLSPTLDLDILRSFVAIAECGSMTQAAKFVYRTPAAISMQIKKLEGLLACSLLLRQSRQIVLTPEGETLLHFARQMLQLNEQTIAQFLKPRLKGILSIGLPDHFGTYELPIILAQFAQFYPSIQVDVALGRSLDLRQRFESGELDLALLSVGLQHRPELSSKTVRVEPLVWVVNEEKALLTARPIPLALAEYGCPWRTLAIEALDNAAIDYRIAYSSENCLGQLAAVKAGLAIAAVPESYALAPLKKLTSTDILPPIGSAQLHLLINPDAGEAAMVLGDFIANSMAE